MDFFSSRVVAISVPFPEVRIRKGTESGLPDPLYFPTVGRGGDVQMIINYIGRGVCQDPQKWLHIYIRPLMCITNRYITLQLSNAIAELVPSLKHSIYGRLHKKFQVKSVVFCQTGGVTPNQTLFWQQQKIHGPHRTILGQPKHVFHLVPSPNVIAKAFNVIKCRTNLHQNFGCIWSPNPSLSVVYNLDLKPGW